MGNLPIELQFSIRDRDQLHLLTNPISMQSTHSVSIFTASVLREELEDIPGRWHSMTVRSNECTFWAFIWCATPCLIFYDYDEHQAHIMDMYLAGHFLIKNLKINATLCNLKHPAHLSQTFDV